MPAELPKGVEQLPSGAYRARFMFQGARYAQTFDTPRQAEGWIRRTRQQLVDGTYIAPTTPARRRTPTFAVYAAEWLAGRTLRPRTRAEYAKLLKRTALLDPVPLDGITRDLVKEWHAGLATGATTRAHAYSLVRTILGTAVDDEILDANPCRIKGGGQVRRQPIPELPTPLEVHQLADAMPTEKHRVAILLAAWCGLRVGELLELRRKDVADDGGVVRVARAVSRVEGVTVVGPPKTAAGVRTVSVPPHIRGDVVAYVGTLPAGPNVLLFPSERSPRRHMDATMLRKPFHAACKAQGVPRLKLHTLRHFSATNAAQSGATLAELQARLGHTTPTMAMRYQHAAAGRDAAVAAAMSANVIKLRPRTTA